MTAEMAYLIIEQSLALEELDKFIDMFSKLKTAVPERPAKKPLMSDAQATENLYRFLKRRKKNLLKK